MSTSVNAPVTDPWKRRVDSGDWDAIGAELDEYGGALLPQLRLSLGELPFDHWYKL